MEYDVVKVNAEYEAQEELEIYFRRFRR